MRFITIGYGARGELFSYYASQLGHTAAAVADPVDFKRELAKERLNTQVVVDWTDILFKPKFADYVIITTQDNFHYQPALAALLAGYHILLEKPIAMTWEQCVKIQTVAKEKNLIVGICHVLRYSPYFQKLKSVIDSGLIGKLLSIQHQESIGHIHFTNSYVRGVWRNTEVALPLILAKSCHDLDLIQWFAGSRAVSVSSFGGLEYFTKAHAPVGAPYHCLDGCPIEKKCIYYAPDVYVYKKRWPPYHVSVKNKSDENVLEALKKDKLGRCVYLCDNNQPDHLVTSMEFENGVTATLHVEAMTGYYGRKTRIFGSRGSIVGDEFNLDIDTFDSGQRLHWDIGSRSDGHGGGDFPMFDSFCKAVEANDSTKYINTLDAAMESHKIGFAAEQSRLTGTTVKLLL